MFNPMRHSDLAAFAVRVVSERFSPSVCPWRANPPLRKGFSAPVVASLVVCRRFASRH